MKMPMLRPYRAGAFLSSLALAALLIVITILPIPPAGGTEGTFLAMLNAYRQEHGVGPLAEDPALAAAAEWMSADMGANAYFSHTDSLGRDPFQRMAAFGYGGNTWKGENLLAGTADPAEALRLWQGSAGHDANLLRPEFRVIGIGRVYTAGSPFGWYWTTDFGGTPSSVTPTASPISTPTPLVTPGVTPAVPTPCACDVDGDGKVTAVDALRVLREVAGLR